jgi:Type I restriction-modification system methyltransferase subunit
MVEVMRPQPGETIADPACGTGGFLLAAHDYIQAANPHLEKAQKKHLKHQALRGVELVASVSRLCAMNLLLHGIGPSAGEDVEPPISTDDSLRSHPGKTWDLVLTNPPFGKKSSVSFVNEEGKRSATRSPTSGRLLGLHLEQAAQLRPAHPVDPEDERPAAVVVPTTSSSRGAPGRRSAGGSSPTATSTPSCGSRQGSSTPRESRRTSSSSTASPPPRTLDEEALDYDLRTNQHFTLKTNPLKRETSTSSSTSTSPRTARPEADLVREEPRGPWGSTRTRSFSLATRSASTSSG